jgi:hypothetical protein
MGAPSPTRDEWPYIESVLVERLEIARAHYEDSKRHFDKAVKDRNDLGLYHPDGAMSLMQASKAFTRRLREYREALIAFNAFILDGKTPEDLKAKHRAQSAAASG